jgi:prepilin-type N-terminal cleavage/methylation domain-containing protein
MKQLLKTYRGGGLFPLICCRTPLRRAEGEGARRKRAGFTLVEVIVVLVILAILAAIAIPALTGYIDKANTSQIKAKARSAAVAMQTILSEAYADPQTKAPGDVYVGGKKIGEVATAYSSISNFPSDAYALLNATSDLVAIFRKLDPSSLRGEGESASVSMLFPLISKHFGLLAYFYIDPETVGAMDDVRVCTYNYDNLEYPSGAFGPTMSYVSTAGFKVWSMKRVGTSEEGGPIFEIVPIG